MGYHAYSDSTTARVMCMMQCGHAMIFNNVYQLYQVACNNVRCDNVISIERVASSRAAQRRTPNTSCTQQTTANGTYICVPVVSMERSGIGGIR